MDDLRELLHGAGPEAEPAFDEEPVRWDQHRHQRRVRTAITVAAVLTAITSFSLCVARDEASQVRHPARAGPTVQIPDNGSASQPTGRSGS